jgi:hypothetical protein
MDGVLDGLLVGELDSELDGVAVPDGEREGDLEEDGVVEGVLDGERVWLDVSEAVGLFEGVALGEVSSTLMTSLIWTLSSHCDHMTTLETAAAGSSGQVARVVVGSFGLSGTRCDWPTISPSTKKSTVTCSAPARSSSSPIMDMPIMDMPTMDTPQVIGPPTQSETEHSPNSTTSKEPKTSPT